MPVERDVQLWNLSSPMALEREIQDCTYFHSDMGFNRRWVHDYAYLLSRTERVLYVTMNYDIWHPGTNTVRLLQDSVIPPHALRGQKAVLRCNYDLEGDNLYSVKWYFNQKEFYRYIPTDNPPVTIFNHHPGVNVNVSPKAIVILLMGRESIVQSLFHLAYLQPQLSTTKEVVLDEIDFLTSGQYRCEISGDAPKFQTASAEGLLFVVGEWIIHVILTRSLLLPKPMPSLAFQERWWPSLRSIWQSSTPHSIQPCL